MKKETHSFSTGRALLALLGIAAMVVAQILGSLAGALPIPRWAALLLFTVIYSAVAVLLVLAIARGVLHAPPALFRLVPRALRPVWVGCAVALPVLVSALFLLLPGEWSFHSATGEELANKLVYALLYCGVSAGVVEETVFRGLLMGALEQRWGRVVAAVVPSVVFACIHMSSALDVVSALQLLVAGTAVGILFSLVTYESGSVWNSALLHAVWNCIIIGGLCSIGAPADAEALCSYTLLTRSSLLTGGAFGIEASLFAVLGYVAVGVLALVRLRRAEAKRAAQLQPTSL